MHLHPSNRQLQVLRLYSALTDYQLHILVYEPYGRGVHRLH